LNDVSHLTTAPTGAHARRPPRLVPLDALRGVLMLLMAVDHASLLVRGVHSYEVWNQPLPVYGDAASFLTRFVTHSCAPGFFFLLGAGAVLSASRAGAGPQDLVHRRLLLRGLLLILLEQLLVDPVLHGRIMWTEFGVLSALGCVLILGSVLGLLGKRVLLGLGLGLVLLGQIPPRLWPDAGAAVPLWARLLFLPGATGEWFVLYPLLPWLGISLLGMAFGRVAAQDERRAYGMAARAGIVALAGFVLLRGARPSSSTWCTGGSWPSWRGSSRAGTWAGCTPPGRWPWSSCTPSAWRGAASWPAAPRTRRAAAVTSNAEGRRSSRSGIAADGKGSVLASSPAARLPYRVLITTGSSARWPTKSVTLLRETKPSPSATSRVSVCRPRCRSVNRNSRPTPSRPCRLERQVKR